MQEAAREIDGTLVSAGTSLDELFRSSQDFRRTLRR